MARRAWEIRVRDRTSALKPDPPLDHLRPFPIKLWSLSPFLPPSLSIHPSHGPPFPPSLTRSLCLSLSHPLPFPAGLESDVSPIPRGTSWANAHFLAQTHNKLNLPRLLRGLLLPPPRYYTRVYTKQATTVRDITHTTLHTPRFSTI